MTRRQPGFTLIELLVVLALIGLLSVVTLTAVRAITRDARLAGAVNTVSAVLDSARSTALKHNDVVLVVLRPRIEGVDDVVVDLVTCRWTGESYANSAGVFREVVDRFEPLPGTPVRTLPSGVKVAAPAYGNGSDLAWVTQSHLPLTVAGLETAGALVAVLYGPDGATLTGNSRTDATLLWVDFDRDPSLPTPAIRRNGADVDPAVAPHVYGQIERDDEPFVAVAPFLAVYDDHEARLAAAGDWSDANDYAAELTGPDGYIARQGNRIHFNRYTGVAMR